MSTLVQAIEQKRFKQAEFLLKLGANVNQREKQSGTTPLLAICLLEDENLACRIAKNLLHRGADVCLQDEHGMNPLMQACKLGKEKLVRVFIKSDECDFSAVDSKGNTALIYSIDVGNSRITKFLTEAMNVYDVRVSDKPNKNGETPLIRAAKLNRNECKDILLSDGKASPCARDFDLKLNAKEWELRLNTGNVDESENRIECNGINCEGNAETGYFNRKENFVYHERSRMKSSIINNRKEFTNTASVMKHSVNFTEKSKGDFFQKRAQSAPLVKREHSSDDPVPYNFKVRSNATLTDKWARPAKETDFTVEDFRNLNEKFMKNGFVLSKEPHSCDKRDIASKMQYSERESSLMRKDTILRPAHALEQERKAKQSAYRDGGEKVPFSPQSQVPKLFMLMTQQKSHSFRSSAKPRTLEKPSTKVAESGKRTNSRGVSVTIVSRQCTTRRRWSTAMTALGTMGRFPSLYSRSDFETLNPKNLEAMLAKRSPRTRRRSSMQSNTEVFAASSSRKEAKTPTISPDLAKLDPELSHSLPEQCIRSGNLIKVFTGALNKTPVIVENEEVFAS